ncbi:MAG: AI-2E family transporter [Chloroflexota bacterium]|nr:AI-2E family transporter [Chloroflexota bacterium]MDQ5865865.1 AI-2E family transporter [Chloroflexota bacterium]
MSTGDARSGRNEPLEPLLPEIRVTPRQRARLVLVALAVFVVWWLLNQSWDALGPFIIALVLAYLMLPLVDRLARFMARVVAILAVYAVFIGIVWGFIAWLAPVVSHQVGELIKESPRFSEQAQEWGRDFMSWYQGLPISDDMRQSIENGLRNSAGALGTAVQEGVMGTLRGVTRAMGFIVGLLIIPFWLFYTLKDKDRGISAFNNMLPPTWRTDVWRIVRIINGVLSSYIRGQLLLGLIVGVATFIGMLIVGAPYPIVLAIISGLTEIIPVVGPVLGAIPGLILAAFHPEGWVMVLKVLVVYVLVQQLENNLLVPKVQGDSVKLHPSIIMVALVVGSQVGGLFGLIIAVPVAAILRDIYLYLYRRFSEGYSPRQAEASVPSREDEHTESALTREQRELAEEAKRPGINSQDELIEGFETKHDEQAAAKQT